MSKQIVPAPIGHSTFPKMLILNQHYPGIKLLLGKQELCQKSGFLGQNPERATRFQAIKGFWKKYKGNVDNILFQPYLFIVKSNLDNLFTVHQHL